MKKPVTDKFPRPGPVKPRQIRLGNSVPVYMIRAGSQPVARVDILFRAGSWWQPKPLVASSANAMLTEGTIYHSGDEIAQKTDYFGSYINTHIDRDNAFVSIYSLTKHLESLLPLIGEIIKVPSFPERELETLLERKLQSYMIEMNRVGTIAREQFSSALYGKDHPYGQILQPEHFKNVSSDDLHAFHRDFYKTGNCAVFISGSYDEDSIAKLLDKTLGGTGWLSPPEAEMSMPQPLQTEKRDLLILKEDAVQSALRIGRRLFNRSHPDFPGMMVLNSILGGHFGSRLMQNIREKRGYTYGIGSVLAGLRHSGYIAVISEVGAGYRKDAVKEIYNELDRLRNKPVSKKELELTKSLMLGEILGSFDGPFAWLESIRNLVEHDLDDGFIDILIETINGISAARLQDLAGRYLLTGEMTEVVAGQ
ncbi:MAG: insulinase family protein [Marinilabiliales bacterium]|nr:MAG: insulinase family protein [Marinilabiliales bacterium]